MTAAHASAHSSKVSAAPKLVAEAPHFTPSLTSFGGSVRAGGGGGDGGGLGGGHVGGGGVRGGGGAGGGVLEQQTGVYRRAMCCMFLPEYSEGSLKVACATGVPRLCTEHPRGRSGLYVAEAVAGQALVAKYCFANDAKSSFPTARDAFWIARPHSSLVFGSSSTEAHGVISSGENLQNGRLMSASTFNSCSEAAEACACCCATRVA